MSDAAYAYKFTVFTPTYNRAHTLPRVHASLEKQTFRDFEWLIVDDGSTDGTRDLVSGWRSSPIPIRYIHQANAGKHVAFNRGVREAKGELFLTVDSDDELVPVALERLQFHWDTIPEARKAHYSAVTALCMDQSGRLLGDRFPQDVTDSDSLELHFKHKSAGDKIGFQRTEVLRRHPFPEPAGLRFVAESMVWFAIARTHKTRFVNECLLVVHRQDGAGGGGGERLSRLTSSTARGRLMFHQTVLNDYLDYCARSPSQLMRSLVNYSRYSFMLGIGVRSQLQGLTSLPCRAALAGVLPFGYALHVRELLRRDTRREG